MSIARGAIKGAVIGYGGPMNMGKHHADRMREAGIEFAAVCELDPARMAQAAAEFPHIRTYAHVEELLAQPDIDLVTVITPHQSHALLGRKVLESGKHCILEKPMCIKADDADKLISTAKRQGAMLSVYHNRRWDGWYVTARDAIANGLLGDIFYAECFIGGFGHPGNRWRSDKEISGGILYDWGAHYIDWLLGIVPGNAQSVRGYAQKRLWHDVTNEDQLDCAIFFDSGAVIQLQASQIAHAGKAERRILGTKGAIVSSSGTDQGYLTCCFHTNGGREETKIPFLDSPSVSYYRNIADHLLHGADLIVKPEQTRRVIAILEAAGQSSEQNRELPVR